MQWLEFSSLLEAFFGQQNRGILEMKMLEFPLLFRSISWPAK
jgi:hypothetical protein